MTTVRDDVEKQNPAADEHTPTADEVAVAESLATLARTFSRARAKMLAAAAHDVEWSAQITLKCLATEGPMRASDLAEHTRADPSTVSRQVAALVREGLVERRADPEDGRASLLVLTDKAAGVLKAHDDLRNKHFAALLAGWSEREVHSFARLLARFTQDFQRATLEWSRETNEPRHAPAEGND
jgi:DNA-binding MarR family transcriptional regulator